MDAVCGGAFVVAGIASRIMLKLVWEMGVERASGMMFGVATRHYGLLFHPCFP